MRLFSRAVMTLGSGISLKVIHMSLVLELFNTILLFNLLPIVACCQKFVACDLFL